MGSRGLNVPHICGREGAVGRFRRQIGAVGTNESGEMDSHCGACTVSLPQRERLVWVRKSSIIWEN